VKLRLVQRAEASASPLVLCYLVGPHLDAELRAALPGCGIVATSENGVGTGAIWLDRARQLAGVDGRAPLCLVGYSAGCQGVRRHLLDGVEPLALAAIDGTHASWPPADWQIEVWARAMDRAIAGRCTVIATCTQQRYTERLGPGQAYASTRTVLERASGTMLAPGTEVHDGGLHLLSYASADIDAAAHIRQQREVLPDVLRRYVAPALTTTPTRLGIVDVVTSAARWLLAPSEPVIVEPRALGLRALEIARTQLGVRESSGKNDGAPIAQYFDGATRIVSGKEQPTGWLPGWDWCAAFASWCGWRAAGSGEQPPHGKRIAVWELVRDARQLGRWDDVSGWGRGPRPGDLVVWRRSGDPRLEGQTGHVSRVVSWDGVSLVTIGGNEENRVREADVAADLGRAVGVIRY
jgi:hypothetical protein